MDNATDVMYLKCIRKSCTRAARGVVCVTLNLGSEKDRDIDPDNTIFSSIYFCEECFRVEVSKPAIQEMILYRVQQQRGVPLPSPDKIGFGLAPLDSPWVKGVLPFVLDMEMKNQQGTPVARPAGGGDELLN